MKLTNPLALIVWVIVFLLWGITLTSFWLGWWGTALVSCLFAFLITSEAEDLDEKGGTFFGFERKHWRP